jgi:orotate phosphoribosyltransferase
MNQEQVLEQCRRCGAMLEGHFQLSSGRHSDRYFQCALLLSDPLRAETLARAVALKIEVSVDVVVGPALGAVVWAHEVARALGTNALFTERVDGEMTMRRGFTLEPGRRVLVVEDVLTTGGSAREAIRVVQGTGAEVVGVASIVNRSGVANPFEPDGLPLACLAEVEVQSWEPAACPLCANAEAGPAVKPGSRAVQGAKS